MERIEYKIREGESEVKGIQLQHATSPLDVTKLHTLKL